MAIVTARIKAIRLATEAQINTAADNIDDVVAGQRPDRWARLIALTAHLDTLLAYETTDASDLLPPASLTVGLGAGELTVAWTASTGGGAGTKTYTVILTLNGIEAYRNTADTITRTITGLTGEAAYAIEVFCVDGIGTVSESRTGTGTPT